MKRLLFALAFAAVVWSAASKAEAGADVSIDFFYNNLGNDGAWLDAGDYGYCWQPAVAVNDSNWRPYSDGYWAYTDVGWTWVSYEDFGWATYHYGRWARLRDHGWVWVPGREWGPAWVSWRTGGDYVGWAPLPPRYSSGGAELVYEGRPISTTVDLDFDIGPSYYNFVNVRYIGEPLLRERIYASSENINYIGSTVNVTNITYANSTVYNYGPDYNRLSAYSARPIQRLSLQREANVDYNAAVQAGNFTRVQGDRLVVAAPMTLQKPAQPIAPPQVKTKIAQPNFETGWSGVSDPQAKAEMQKKIKAENPKAVPPPKVQPTNPAALTATPPPAPGAATAPATTSTSVAPAPTIAPAPGEHGKGRNKQQPPVISPGPVAPNAAPAASVASPLPSGQAKDKGKNTHGDVAPQVAPPTGVTPAVASTPAPMTPPAAGRGKAKDKRNQQAPAAPPVTAPAPITPKHEDKGRGKNKDLSRPNLAPEIAPPAPSNERVMPPPPPQMDRAPKGRDKKAERQPIAPPPQAPPQAAPPRPQIAPPPAAPPEARGSAPQRGGGPEKGDKKKKKGDEQPPGPGQ